jgi:hypothetical protein
MSGTRHTRKSSRKHSCTRKRRFDTKRQAGRYRRWRVGQGAAEWTCGVYGPCRFCGGYHVGHRPDPRGVHRH